MENELDEIKKLWQKAKDTNKDQSTQNIVDLIALGETKKKSTLLAHYGNALVLTATVAVLVFYFYYLYDFQDVLSNIGINVMIGGLTLRIVIEIFSAIRSRRINISDTAAQSIQNSVSFYNFRKRIHGPVTIFIFVAYVIGFYFLTPEFSRHLDLTWVILMDASALIIFIVLALVIRKGIRQEFKDLEKIVELQTTLTKEN
jgi:uncharacterized membrane protein